MEKKILQKTGDYLDYVHDELIDRIEGLRVDCPECENIIHDDPQYQCGTCDGGGQVWVLDWIKKQIK